MESKRQPWVTKNKTVSSRVHDTELPRFSSSAATGPEGGREDLFDDVGPRPRADVHTAEKVLHLLFGVQFSKRPIDLPFRRKLDLQPG